MSVDLEDFEFAVAERFPDAFPTDLSVRPTTPRDLVDHLAANVSPSHGDVQLTVRAFYRIRRVLASSLDITARRIAPRTPLAEVMPHLEVRRPQWLTIRNGLRLTVDCNSVSEYVTLSGY